ncbi:MAG: transglutaminase-like domain-containing protein [Halobacteriota archaeon]
MTHLSKITEHGHPAQEAPKQSKLAMGSTIIKMLLANPSALRKMRVMDPDEERYVRPPRPYDLPEYRQGMRYCTSSEKYLRPTRYCNPREPLVIAMANELGAYELSDREFAEAAFWWIKTNFTPEFLSFNNVSETIERGTGTCFHTNSVWAALCRAAGIKARYKSFPMALPDEMMSVASSFGETGEIASTAFNRELRDVEGEVCIDGKWVVGHVAMRPEVSAASGLPVSRFGEDAMDLSFKRVPGSVERFESISLRTALIFKAMISFIPATMERTSFMAAAVVPRGREIIEEAGGLEVYDRKARERMLSSLTVETKDDTVLVFED